MGLFLMMSGVAQAGKKQVEVALRDFATQRAGTFTPLAAGEGVAEKDTLVIAETKQGNVTVVYPQSFTDWEAASQHLSATLSKPVFSLHIHDGDLWMYLLFSSGQEVDRFNSVPEYWEELPEAELASWSGDASAICRYWPGINEEQISHYLVPWDEAEDEDEENEEAGPKAYPNDKYGVGEVWQVIDFMAKLDLDYPFDEQGSPLGSAYRFDVKG
jgi:hypothetical protein